MWDDDCLFGWLDRHSLQGHPLKILFGNKPIQVKIRNGLPDYFLNVCSHTALANISYTILGVPYNVPAQTVNRCFIRLLIKCLNYYQARKIVFR